MSWKFKPDFPIYIQITEKIKINIITGIYRPGEKLPSVRDLALEASVNPNTVQKALSELEESCVVSTHRTAGRYVTEDLDLIRTLKMQAAEEKVSSFLKQMKEIGYSTEDSLLLIQEKIRGN